MVLKFSFWTFAPQRIETGTLKRRLYSHAHNSLFHNSQGGTEVLHVCPQMKDKDRA